MLVLKESDGIVLSCSGWDLRASAWWTVACTVGDISRASLSDTRRSQMSIVLVDGGLHLFEYLVDRGQVATSLCVAHRWKTVGLDGVFGLVPTTNRDRLVCRDCKIRRNDLGQLKTLELKEATADVVKIGRVKLSTSDLAEEMVKRIIATLASFVVVSGRRHGAVVSHRAIAGVLYGVSVL
jgi:hypothetical protein